MDFVVGLSQWITWNGNWTYNLVWVELRWPIVCILKYIFKCQLEAKRSRWSDNLSQVYLASVYTLFTCGDAFKYAFRAERERVTTSLAV